jgi:hypothetical protein
MGADRFVYVELAVKKTWEDAQRPRSYPFSFQLLCGALSIFMLWISTVAAVVSLVMKYTGHHDPWTVVSVVSLLSLIVSLALTLGISLTKKCPLCHGPPLHSRRCRKHRLAERWPLLTHRATVVLRILTSLSFRCMYCGTPFRLFKKSSREKRC